MTTRGPGSRHMTEFTIVEQHLLSLSIVSLKERT